MYAAKILFALDTRLQRHLEDCRMADDRSEVDESILNLSEILVDVQNGRFFMDLPPSFEQLNLNAELNDDGGSFSRKTKSKKRKLDNDNEQESQLDKNEEPIPGVCLKEGESFKDVFRGKLIDQRPMWDSKRKMCARYHIKHVCFKDCRQKESHQPNSKVPEGKKKEMRDYVKKVREL